MTWTICYVILFIYNNNAGTVPEPNRKRISPVPVHITLYWPAALTKTNRENINVKYNISDCLIEMTAWAGLIVCVYLTYRSMIKQERTWLAVLTKSGKERGMTTWMSTMNTLRYIVSYFISKQCVGLLVIRQRACRYFYLICWLLIICESCVGIFLSCTKGLELTARWRILPSWYQNKYQQQNSQSNFRNKN